MITTVAFVSITLSAPPATLGSTPGSGQSPGASRSHPAPPVVVVPYPEVEPPPAPPPPPAARRTAPRDARAPVRLRRHAPARGWAVIRCLRPRRPPRLWLPCERRRRHARRRRSRCRSRYAPRPYHYKSTPYLGVEVGHLALLAPKGSPFRLLQPTAWIAGFFGWNLHPFFGLELGVGGSPLRSRDEGLGDLRRVGVAAVSLDARLRVVEPAPYNPVVPYLQGGVGGYWFGGQSAPSQPGGCGAQGCLLSRGVGAHLGGGLDIYLTRGAILGLRVMYRHLFLSSMRCPPGTPCAALAGDAPRTQVPGLSATAHFTLFWTHL